MHAFNLRSSQTLAPLPFQRCFAKQTITIHLCNAGLLATQQAARSEGNPEAADKTKVSQMFGSGSPLKPFIEPLTMYYQVTTPAHVLQGNSP